MKLERVHNFRDLGGLTTGTGRRVRRGRLYRSSELTHASSADVAALTEAGVRTIVDLRTAGERRTFGSPQAFGDGVVFLPLLDDDDLDATLAFPDLAAAYAHYLRRPPVGRRLVQLLRLLADEERLPVVISCSAGKDRTGLATSAVLGALGVPDDAVADDYAASAPALPGLYTLWADNPASTIEERLRTHSHLLFAPRDAMTQLLYGVRHDFGSMRDYLRRHGATDALFADLERVLLEPVRDE